MSLRSDNLDRFIRYSFVSLYSSSTLTRRSKRSRTILLVEIAYFSERSCPLGFSRDSQVLNSPVLL